MKTRKKDLFFYYCLFFSIALFCIVLYRSAKASITYDEAYTYIYYIYKNPLHVFSNMFAKGTLANNHLLNSFFISFIQQFFSTKYNEVLIRMPNVLSYIVYLFYSYKFSKEFKYKFATFSLFALNYGASEYFSLGRGYGISCAFVMTALYYFLKFIKYKNNLFNLSLCYLFFLISCYANTAALIPFATVIFVSFYILFKNRLFKEYLCRQWYFYIPIVCLTLVIIKYHFSISSDGLPLYGGDTSFYKDVIISLFYNYGFFIKYIYLFSSLVLILFLILLVYYIKNKKNDYFVISGILYFVILIFVTKISNSMWLTGRCLIPSMPLLFASTSELIQQTNIKKQILNTILTIFLLILFICNIKLDRVRDFSESRYYKKICYDAYFSKDNTYVKNIKPHMSLEFYSKKINYYYNYDILK